MSLSTDRAYATTIPTAAREVRFVIHAEPVASGAQQFAVNGKAGTVLIESSLVGAAFIVDAQARGAILRPLELSRKDLVQPIRVCPRATTPTPGQRTPDPVQTT